MYLEPPFDASEAVERADDCALAVRLERIDGGAEGAFSRNTERAVRSDLSIFARWCAERGLRGLPAEPGTVAAFVDAMAEQRAPATVRRLRAYSGYAISSAWSGRSKPCWPSMPKSRPCRWRSAPACCGFWRRWRLSD